MVPTATTTTSYRPAVLHSTNGSAGGHIYGALEPRGTVTVAESDRRTASNVVVLNETGIETGGTGDAVALRLLMVPVVKVANAVVVVVHR